MKSPNEVGLKYDEDKLRWDLLPWEELEEVAKVVTRGAAKYNDNNWQMVEPKTRYLAALLRHVIAYAKGEKIDKEWGIPHLAHAACNCLFLMWKDNHEHRDEEVVCESL